MKQLGNCLTAQISSQFAAAVGELRQLCIANAGGSNHQLQPPAMSSNVNVHNVSYTLYSWRNKFHCFPETFTFPTSVSTQVVWNVFVFGSNTLYPPYRRLAISDFKVPTGSYTNIVYSFKLIECGRWH